MCSHCEVLEKLEPYMRNKRDGTTTLDAPRAIADVVLVMQDVGGISRDDFLSGCANIWDQTEARTATQN